MKEAFWGVLIVLLGLFGIVVVNIFQNVTVDNDRVYYLIKESTEASAYDALDLTYYRLSGKLRIVEDKFVENLTRRFAENVTIGDYRIVVEDINEMPPKVSLRVRSGVATLRGEKFGIVNRVDGILETKYKLDEVLDFLGITKEEWDRAEGSTIEKDENTGENICKVVTDNKDEIECITGDIKFVGFEDADISESVCQDETPSGAKERKVKYKVCDCGKWVEESETLTANPTKVGNEWVYTWTFNKAGEIRTISETLKTRVRIDVCTTAIEEMVPKDIDEVKPNENGEAYQPSTDNSSYMTCPTGGIKIPVGMKFVMHPNYIPPESVNRILEWSSTDDTIVGVQGRNPTSTCWINKEDSICFSRGIITAKKVGTAYVNVMTKRNQTASCKVEVFDGKVESIGCKDVSIMKGVSTVIEPVPYPKNSTIINYEYSISNTNIATLTGNSVDGKTAGTATITIKETNTGKTGTCKVTVKNPQQIDYSGGSSGGDSGGDDKPKQPYIITGPDGKVYSSYDKATALKTAAEISGTGKAVVTQSNGNGTSKKVAEATQHGATSGSQTTVKIYDGNNEPWKTVTTTVNNGKTTQSTTDSSGKTTTKCLSNCSTPSNSSSSSGSSSGGSSGGGSKGSSSSGSSSGGSKGSSSSGSSSGGSKGSSSSGSSSGGSRGNVLANPPSGGKNCFEAGTKVLTINGYKDIDKLKIGDMVLSYNVDTNENEYKMVTKLYVHNNVNEELYSLNINNKILKVTGKHRFYIKTNCGYEWTSAEKLKVGDLVMDSNGNYYPIRRITSMTVVENVYNIEVEDNHNYYVSRDNILVHNRKAK